MRSALPDEPYRFRMGLSQGSIASFFGVRADDAEALAERRAILAHDGARIRSLEGSGALVDEAVETFRTHGVLSEDVLTAHEPVDARLHALGTTLVPDLLLLDLARGGAHLVAGVVCFPSTWSLTAKIGRPLPEIHMPVPGLETQVGDALARFLERMKPGRAFLRSGFGLSTSDERDQHPSRTLPRLGSTVDAARVFVRVEDQALVKLPVNDGVLFGIRIRHAMLGALDDDPEILRGLERALATMPDEVAAYKGLSDARPGLLAYLARRLAAAANADGIA